MHVPSRLNEYPVGSTTPTLWRDAPARSSLTSIRGSTVSDDDEQLVLQQAHELEDREAAKAGEQAENAEHEQRCGPPERRHQQRQVLEGAAAELRDRDRHPAEGPERRGPHDQPDDA